ncbi:MAG: LysM peptidoglycan-binding domain-containing protein [Beijerinckiaceae bacterium]
MLDKSPLLVWGAAAVVTAATAGLAYRVYVAQMEEQGLAKPATEQTAGKPGASKLAALPSKPADAGPQKPSAASPAAGPASAKSPDPARPAFDIVRVEPSGDAVVAGRAQPGADVELLNKGKPVASAKADPNGQFVIIPKALVPGAHQFQLRARTRDKSIDSEQAVTVSVPEKGKKDVMVALAAPDKPTVILSDAKPPGFKPASTAADPKDAATKPGQPPQAGAKVAALPANTDGDAASPVRIRIVEAEQKGGFYVTGLAAPGSRIRIYLNGSYVAEVQTGPSGEWSLRVGRGMSPGDYDVRADLVDPATGKVLSRAAVPFNYPARVAAAPATASPAPARPAPAGPVPASPAPASPAAASPVPASPAAAPPAPAKSASNAPQKAASATPDTPGPAQAATSAASPVSAAPASAGQKSQQPPLPSAAPAVAIGLAPPEPPAHVVVERLTTANVAKGDSLWRISRTMLGQGIRYTQIYAANTNQIRNPNLIYPGQVLVVPLEKPAN